MRIEINQTISNTLSVNRKIIRSTTSESYVIYPDTGKVIRNKLTGKIYSSFVYLTKKDKVDDFEEITK